MFRIVSTKGRVSIKNNDGKIILVLHKEEPEVVVSKQDLENMSESLLALKEAGFIEVRDASAEAVSETEGYDTPKGVTAEDPKTEAKLVRKSTIAKTKGNK